MKYKPVAQADVPNLDAMSEDELMAFWMRYQNRQRRKDAFALVGGGPNYTNWAARLGGYAANKATAMSCRKRGDIQAALIYEKICDLIYDKLPDALRW